MSRPNPGSRNPVRRSSSEPASTPVTYPRLRTDASSAGPEIAIRSSSSVTRNAGPSGPAAAPGSWEDIRSNPGSLRLRRRGLGLRLGGGALGGGGVAVQVGREEVGGHGGQVDLGGLAHVQDDPLVQVVAEGGQHGGLL